ncbi:PREDICTED: probable tRNA N6-adenosine threonylcarbamoyltransferase, mitochondrial isoform X1 [Priapulus caudatus]|uniref:N(6)-L-threonylcarbamoyladenine synthase n=1 Tax=Priapulus caudatus TaxID=37621 RepID=A0ABM1DWR3_PRICU|nr:PREDICTED: probable tRNA N6-adenosine threonylcarbamoyltransferase, mitochondrial isoform X1 [Priapulus caudatus]XP_014664382.1 PREDICTED: probable tRNA N6-adenosine threonylcarbamoyltransferase, mitochondrial isoform X1 [Priapulus caudatus]XP_014664383.1 PREDICTED: probable tRNA N6-adenosine threonylcarbamoyltransferase, mitochondrial isoform X1 [Priapulus caudatus]XP_014664384.1 PREDICTED: probable tRNA N6-adenosine threonylcarbamoyltransferase, mitochondrial isoform X1 [Priapulus caudatus]
MLRLKLNTLLGKQSLHKILRSLTVLGIETSCDDTGAAIVDDTGQVLAQEIHSQQQMTIRLGGVIPPIARRLHEENIERVVTATIESSNIPVEQLDGIACTVKPGMPLSLLVGLKYARELVRRAKNVPFLPVHHMQAHALTVRMVDRVAFPFLVFLLSGGHCLLAIVKDVEDFMLLGESIDTSPGEAYDKVARRLKLKNLPECDGMSGGESVERVARRGDPHKFVDRYPATMSKYRDCNFSFSGMKTTTMRLIEREEEKHGIVGDGILPNVCDVAAAFQLSVGRHLLKRLQRCLVFIDYNDLLPKHNRTLVLSGGVACNSFIRQVIGQLCDHHEYDLVCPPPQLCTDNGVMVAWNGMEKLKVGKGIASDPELVDIEPKCSIGPSMIRKVQEANIQVPRFKIDLTKFS